MKNKTSELTGPALDWAVAKIESEAGADGAEKQWRYFGRVFHPSTDWAQGGPIIQREEIDIYCHESPKTGCGWWVAEITGTKAKAKGTSPLSAAMRCYVASKLGDEVDIPEELL